VTILGAQRPKGFYSIPCKAKRLISSEIGPDGSWNPPNSSSADTCDFFVGGLKWLQLEADYLPAYGVRLRMRGTVHPLFSMLSYLDPFLPVTLA